MKILMINKSDHGGGAAIAATGIAQALRKYCGCEVLFASAKALDTGTVRLRNRAGWLIEEFLDRITRKAGLEYTCLPFSKQGILKAVNKFKPDIIHLHNIHSGYFETELIYELAKKASLIWSIHDMWGLTGHCTVTKGCTKWETGCGKCPHLDIYPALGIDSTARLFKRKLEIIQRIDIVATSPSEWISGSLKKSPVWKGKRIEKVSYGIDEELFRPLDRADCRKRFEISGDAFTVLLTAEKLTGGTKGEGVIGKIMDSVAEKTKKECVLLTGGKTDLRFSSNKFRHIHAGYLRREDMPLLYNASDVNASPTAGEAFGLTIVEAGLCDVPSVVFDAGGTVSAMGEIQKHNLVKTGDIADFAARLAGLSEKEKPALRQYYSDNFSLKKCAGDFYSIYKEILEKK